MLNQRSGLSAPFPVVLQQHRDREAMTNTPNSTPEFFDLVRKLSLGSGKTLSSIAGREAAGWTASDSDAYENVQSVEEAIAMVSAARGLQVPETEGR